jgi:hypothetical protein
MPVGAAIGGAVIAGGATIGSGLLGADAQRDAAQQASDTSLQVAQMNADLFKQTRDQNLAIASPFYNNGLLASNALTDLLLGTHLYNQATVAKPTVPGGGTFPTSGSGSVAGGSSNQSLAEWAQGAINAMAPKITRSSTWATANGITDPVAKLNYLLSQSPSSSDQYPLYQSYLSSHPRPAATATGTSTGTGALSGYAAAQGTGRSALETYMPQPGQQAATTAAAPLTRPLRGDFTDRAGFQSALHAFQQQRAAARTGTPAPGGTTGTTTGGTTAPATAQNAWDAFRNSTNYQWRLGQGMGALTSAQSAKGALDSGAATKAAITFNQNYAANELSNYMNLLAGQQNMGLSAAGAVMGVGNTYSGNVAAQNTSAANAAANAALVNGQANAGMWGSIGQGVGQLGGALYQYGMGQQQSPYNFSTAYNTANSSPWSVDIGSAAPVSSLPVNWGGFS